MKNKSQNYSNHVHYVPLYHYLTFTAMAILLGGGIYQLAVEEPNELVNRSMFLLLVLTVISVSFHCRSFALKVQDRTIRAEENFRYYRLTGKTLPEELSLPQVFALRFASDAEFLVLTERAIKEGLSPTEIKKQITIWRADYLRA